MGKYKYIISASKDGETRYVIFDTANGRSVATEDIGLATVFPSKQFCKIVIKLLQPVIAKENLGVSLEVMEV